NFHSGIRQGATKHRAESAALRNALAGTGYKAFASCIADLSSVISGVFRAEMMNKSELRYQTFDVSFDVIGVYKAALELMNPGTNASKLLAGCAGITRAKSRARD